MCFSAHRSVSKAVFDAALPPALPPTVFARFGWFVQGSCSHLRLLSCSGGAENLVPLFYAADCLLLLRFNIGSIDVQPIDRIRLCVYTTYR